MCEVYSRSDCDCTYYDDPSDAIDDAFCAMGDEEKEETEKRGKITIYEGEKKDITGKDFVFNKMITDLQEQIADWGAFEALGEYEHSDEILEQIRSTEFFNALKASVITVFDANIKHLPYMAVNFKPIEVDLEE